MKRVIKFRGYNTTVNKMVYDKNLIFKPNQDRPQNWHFMQYIGLKDKNGKEIYEGDILNLHVFTEELGEGYGVVEGEKEYIGEVFIAEFGMALKLGKGEDDWFYLLNVNGMIHEESFELIGNIYENEN